MTAIPKPAKRAKKKPKRIPRKTPKRTMLKRLKRKAWELFSVWVRSHDAAGGLGLTECYSCRLWFPWREMHAGHFIHGRLDYDDMAVKPQCVKCNTYLHGNLGAYALHLVDDYGREAVDLLRTRANMQRPYTIEELEAIVVKYQALVPLVHVS